MKKLKINKKIKYLIVIFIALILIISISFKFKNSYTDLEYPKEKFYTYIFFKNINDIENYFPDRKLLIISESNTLLIGRNQKELENGYYDLKFDTYEDVVSITINNLQKEDIDFRSISDEYLNELKTFLAMLLNNKNIDELINMVKKEYIELRNNDECVDNKHGYKQMNIEQYVIDFNIEDNMLKINIKI